MVETHFKLLCIYNYNFNRIYWELGKIALDSMWKNQQAKIVKNLKKNNSALIDINIH